MLFNSVQFLAFFTLLLPIYWLLRRSYGLQNWLLLGASYLFYGAWDARFLLLLIGSTLIDYLAGRKMAVCPEGAGRRRWLMLSLVGNLGVLAVFKYLDFGVESLAALLAVLGFEAHLPTLGLILPVGISFYTFQTLGYSLDVYAGRRKPVGNLRDFALYVAYFPQLVAGPIERSTFLIPQLQRSRQIDWERFRRGCLWLIQGYFYKSVVADSVAPYVDEIYAMPGDFSGPVLLLATFGFALQVFGDFAGYTLIARGCSCWLGIDLSVNFRRPYLARDPAEFWRRWHITLSDWFRNYLFTPLALFSARRFSPAWAQAVPIWVTFVMIGIWHGAGWNFVLFGAYWGGWLVAFERWRKWRPERWTRNPVYSAGALVATFVGTLVSFVFFRSGSMAAVWDVFSGITRWSFEHPLGIYARVTAVLAAPVFALMVWEERRDDSEILLRSPVLLRWSFYIFVLLLVAVLGFRPTPFIYFQF